jgi:hypothetical protein
MKELQDDEATLADCGLRNGSRLRLVLSLRGGPISTRRLPVLSCSDAESEQYVDIFVCFLRNSELSLLNNKL